jgi:hypothetical protein
MIEVKQNGLCTSCRGRITRDHAVAQGGLIPVGKRAHHPIREILRKKCISLQDNVILGLAGK